jgi:FKBP-type peptidyl-prolyl cis-trans isomerase FkpA
MKFYLSIFIYIVVFSACKEETQQKKRISEKEIQERLIKANQKLSKNEIADIEAYILKNSLKMERSGTGLRYFISGEGKGDFAKTGMKATVKYKISLLNGRVCYTSDNNGVEQFVVDNDQVESGLHEGIKRMKVGNKAKFILPSHLAHGLIGDEEKIPARATLIYDIELLELDK